MYTLEIFIFFVKRKDLPRYFKTHDFDLYIFNFFDLFKSELCYVSLQPDLEVINENWILQNYKQIE